MLDVRVDMFVMGMCTGQGRNVRMGKGIVPEKFVFVREARLTESRRSGKVCRVSVNVGTGHFVAITGDGLQFKVEDFHYAEDDIVCEEQHTFQPSKQATRCNV